MESEPGQPHAHEPAHHEPHGSAPARSLPSGWQPMALAALAVIAVALVVADGGYQRISLLVMVASLLLSAVPRLGIVAPVACGVAVLAVGVASGEGFWDARMTWLSIAAATVVLGLASARTAARDLEVGRRIASLAAQAEGRSIRDAVNDALGKRRSDNYVDREFVRAQRYGREVTVAMADIDNLALLREQQGAAAVEQALVALGGLFSDDTRLPDGGVSDELRLVFVLPETPLLGGRVVAERVRLGFQAMRLAGADGVPLTVSVGVASYPGDGQRGSEVIAAAGIALDKAIARGGNRTVLSRSPAGSPAGWSAADDIHPG